ncbi:MAG: hypothetical protein ACFFDR_05780 [Candidatus Thorarchaeota archaeon]
MSPAREILLDGKWMSGEVTISRVPNSFQVTPEQKRTVNAEWLSKPSDAQDLPLWRFEGFSLIDRNLELQVSLCTYRWHFILRHHNYTNLRDYPNPLSETTLIHTADNKLILGIRKGSDQGNTLHAVGGGFIDPLKDANENYLPENPFDTSMREMLEETTLNSKDLQKDKLTMLGLAWGRNHDTTCVIHAPVRALAEDIEINAPEHSELIKVDVDSPLLTEIVCDGHLRNRESIPATDHLILALNLFLTRK